LIPAGGDSTSAFDFCSCTIVRVPWGVDFQV
jgi:hypothetical protein